MLFCSEQGYAGPALARMWLRQFQKRISKIRRKDSIIKPRENLNGYIMIISLYAETVNIMHRSGSFSPQIQKLVTEGKKQCGWILRTFNTRDALPMLTL